jgi:hypothetical protein
LASATLRKINVSDGAQMKAFRVFVKVKG